MLQSYLLGTAPTWMVGTPLHLAAYHGFLGVTRTLVECNADIKVRDGLATHHYTEQFMNETSSPKVFETDGLVT